MEYRIHACVFYTTQAIGIEGGLGGWGGGG